MHVALDRGHQDLALLARSRSGCRRFGRKVGLEPCHSALHDAGRLDHLREEHLAGSEEVADDIHSAHERTLNHRQRTAQGLHGLFGILFHKGIKAVDQTVLDAGVDGEFAPRFVLLADLAGALDVLGVAQKALGGIVAAVEEHVFDAVAEFRLNLLVDDELAGVDDAHVHSVANSVVEEAGVHCLAHVVVAAKAEADVGDTAADFGPRKVLLDPSRSLKEVEGVAAVLVHACRDGEDVGVKDDVFGGESVGHQQVVGALADFDAAVVGIRLALLVEGHDDDGGSEAAAVACLVEEFRLARFERDGIDDGLALDALEAGRDDFPLRRVDHDGNARNVGL